MTPSEQRERDEQALREAEAKLVEAMAGETDEYIREWSLSKYILGGYHSELTARVGYLRELVRRHELRGEK